MGVRLVVGIADGSNPAAVLYDSVSGWSIGPVFEAEDSDAAVEAAEAFQAYAENSIGGDIRRADDSTLEAIHRRYIEEKG